MPKEFGANPHSLTENLNQRLYAEQLYAYRDANKKQLYKALVQMAKDQIIERLDADEA